MYLPHSCALPVSSGCISDDCCSIINLPIILITENFCLKADAKATIEGKKDVGSDTSITN